MRLIFGIISFAFLFSFCSKEVIQNKLNSPSEKGSKDEQISKDLSNGAFRLFDYTARNTEANANVIISPLSMQYALGMADNGAYGATLAQLMNVNLQDSNALHSLNQHLAFLYHQLANTGKELQLSLSNAVFYDKAKVNIRNSYLNALRQFYAPDIQSLDFNDKVNSLREINGWVKTATNGKIEKVLDDITQDEFMFLINALYMKADWDHPFAPELTNKQEFHTNSGAIVNADFMHQRLYANVLVNGEMEVVSLPMGAGQIEAIFILPKKKDINTFIKEDFNSTLFEKVAQNARNTDVMIDLPKIKMVQKFDLKQILQSMGVTVPFTDGADFSGIAGGPGDVYLTRALHDVFMQMDEKGIEGAAVTTIGVGVTSMPPSLTFNRPFVFAIRDKSTGTNLFLGKITDPTQEN